MKPFIRTILFSFLFSISSLIGFTQSDSSLVAASDTVQIVPTWIIVGSDTLFPIYANIGPFKADDRVEGVHQRLSKIRRYPILKKDSLIISKGMYSDDISYGNIHIMSITDDDAKHAGKLREVLSQEYHFILEKAIEKSNVKRDMNYWLIHTGYFLLSLAGLILLLYFIKRIFRWILKKVDVYTSKSTFRQSKFLKLLSYFAPKKGHTIIHLLVRLIRIILVLLILFFYLPFLFAFLPWTENFARKFFNYIADPIRFLAEGFLDFLPDLIFIIVIIIITRYFVRTLKNIATEIKTGKFAIKGFYPDWAGPTFNLVRVIIWVFAIIIIFPHIPGSDSPAFQGLSIFLGVLFSLGST